MRPVSMVVPKELLPIGTVPMIQFAVEEAASAGIEQVVFVINRRKNRVKKYFERLQKKGSFRQVTFEYRYQEEPTGLAAAIECGRDLTEARPFALLLPDNVFLSPQYGFSSMLKLYQQHRQDIVGVIQLSQDDSDLYGNVGRIDYEPLAEASTLRITRLYDKQPGTLTVPPGERVLRTCGRYVFHSDFFGYVDRVRPGVTGEFDEVPVVQRIVADRQAIGYLIPPPLFDTGNRRGYLAANAYLHRNQP